MTALRYYRISVAIPVIFPLLALILLSTIGSILPNQVEGMLTFLFLSLVVGGVPYIMIAVPLLIWFRNRDASWYWNFSFVAKPDEKRNRSEEHTSELQSRGHIICRLLLEKKNN